MHEERLTKGHHITRPHDTKGFKTLFCVDRKEALHRCVDVANSVHSAHSVPEVLRCAPQTAQEDLAMPVTSSAKRRLAVPVLLSARLSAFFAGQATSKSAGGGGSDFPNYQSGASELCVGSTPNAGKRNVRSSSSGFEIP